jgi:hypothetical protein
MLLGVAIIGTNLIILEFLSGSDGALHYVYFRADRVHLRSAVCNVLTI